MALCIFLLAVSGTSKKDADGAANVFGMQMRIVVSDSMAKCDETYDDIKQYKIKAIPLRSMVFVQTVPEDEQKANAWYDKLKVGDVLTFRYSYGKQVTITHRIVSIAKNDNGGYTIVLEGDNRAPSTADGQSTVGQQTIHTEQRNSSYNYVIGKVVGQSKVLGFLTYAVKQPIGIALIVIVPCSIIMIMEIVRIVSILNEEKRRKTAEIQQQQSNEIEELRRQLASMQAGMATGTVQQQSVSEQQPITETEQTASETPEDTLSVEQEQTPQSVEENPAQEKPVQAEEQTEQVQTEQVEEQPVQNTEEKD